MLRIITNHFIFYLVFSLWLFIDLSVAESGCSFSSVDAFLNSYNKEANKLQKEDTIASWDYETDMTDDNKKKTTELSGKTSKFSTEARENATCLIDKFGESTEGSKLRQLKLITRTASSKNSDDSKLISGLISKMTAIYSETTILKEIDDKKYKFKLNSHLLPIMSQVSKSNKDNLKWAWNVWRKAVGPKIKPLYEKFVNLVNKGARENGFADYGEFWRKEYEVGDLEGQMETILSEMSDLYHKLHAYTRFKLNLELGLNKTGPIPAQYLNMWAQNWGHLYGMLTPFPKKTVPDVTSEMKNKKYNKTAVLKLAETFFVSLGLDEMPQSFYDKSLFSKVAGKKAVCHPSAWDIGNGDVRLKMPCMSVSQQDLITVHHEMGHAEYYLMYKHQPVEFRTGANPGFHEAVGDTIALSVMTPAHLEEIDLLKESHGDKEEEVNFLLKQALQKIAFIPFSYIVDKWRWSVFKGEIKPDKYNQYWWELRLKYQGVTPLADKSRDEMKDKLFDAGTFFHVAHNTEYLRYFISHVLQFQFHKALCDAAGHTKDYHKCSVYNSKEAGKKLRAMLELGKEKPWPDALNVIAGTKTLSSKPIIAYFKPLEAWLDKHRQANNYQLGW